MAIQREIKKIEIPAYTLAIPVSEQNTIPVQFRITTEDGSKVSAWSNVYEIDGPEIAGTETLTLTSKSNAVKLDWEDDDNRVLYDVFAHRFSNIQFSTSFKGYRTRPSSTTAQIVLYTDSVTSSKKIPHNLNVGMRIAVSIPGATNYSIADTYVVAVPDPYTFIYSPVPTTSGTASETTDGTVEIFGTSSAGYVIDLNDYSFVGRTSKSTFSIPKTFKKKTLGGTSYTVNLSDVWCIVQVASANKQATENLNVTTGAYLAL